MKILIINTYYYPNMIGGTENSIKILAENLAKLDNNIVAVYSADNNNKKLKKEKINNVEMYRGHAGRYQIERLKNFNTKKIKKIRNKILELNNITAKKEIRTVIEDFQPDVIHTNNLFGISTIIWKIAKEKYNIPIIHTLRDYWMLYPIVSNEKLSKILLQPFMRKRTKYVDVVTAPSNCTLEKFIDNGYFKSSKKECVVNAIDIDIEETRRIIDDKTKRKNKDIKFMFVGMLTENKGIRNLLEAFTSIKNDKISLHIYGQGILESLVKDKEKQDNRIKYHGQLKNEDLKEEWIKNDVLIVPSIWEEPFGRVVIEGNQYGLPVIGANRGGIKEIIDLTHAGKTYQFDNIKELKNKIEYFCDRDKIKKYFQNILSNIEIYSIKTQLNTFMNIYTEEWKSYKE